MGTNRDIRSTLLVEEIMTTPVITLKGLNTITEAMEKLIDHGISGAPIVDDMGRVLAIISEFDLMKFAVTSDPHSALQNFIKKLKQGDEIIQIRPYATFVDIFKIFLANGLRRVPVIDKGGYLKGIVARRDVLKVFVQGIDNPLL
ncbi:MAG: CBS domain-containing protein [Bacteriovoracaceae bacterium]|jgi:CBS domain-containing protein|nr:CBS domain-containing protein [Bacteriovoracaceae bacterium]